jgi:hypothetical protein
MTENNISEDLKYHIENKISLLENVFRVGSEAYLSLFREARDNMDNLNLTNEEIVVLKETEIGEYAEYKGMKVPLDCPLMLEEKETPELNKPKRGGPKKFYVYVRDPQTKNIKRINWGDTTGLSVKINDPKARASFAARHKCSTRNDKTTAAYWACRTPYYSKSLGLSGGGSGFW